MPRCITGLLGLFISFDLYAKCAPPLINEAIVEISSCQAVAFFASDSKFNIFNSGVFDVPHIPGEKVSGTLIVGKVVEAKEIDSKKANTITDKIWKNGEVKTFFISTSPNETCPKILPDTRKVIEQVKCCDVIPSRGICLLPKTIPIVHLAN